MSDEAIPEDVINPMCLTWRHDFGMVLDEEPRVGYWGVPSGMTEEQREALRRDMRQLYRHHVIPAILAERAAERERCAKIAEKPEVFMKFSGDFEGDQIASAIRSSHE